MSIIYAGSDYYLLDDVKHYSEIYRDLRMNYKAALYQIDEPFLMQSEVQALNAQRLAIADLNALPRRKRKSKKPIVNANNYIAEICDQVQSRFNQIMKECQTAGYLNDELDPNRLLTGNKVSRDALNCVDRHIETKNVTKKTDDLLCSSEITNLVDSSPDFLLLSKCVYCNSAKQALACKISGMDYLIPACSSFVQSDVLCGLRLLSNKQLKFNVVIIDPPWINRSVKRKRNYQSEPEEYLLQLPLADVMKPNALVAIWVTNNQRLQEFVKEKVAKKFNLVFIGTYYWIKVTRTGQPVCSFNPNYKMPFEPIFVFRHSQQSNPTTVENGAFSKFILSTPCVVPSRKPPLSSVLCRDFNELATNDENSDDSRMYLELFARNLQPQTFSIGDQVLYMQCYEWFE